MINWTEALPNFWLPNAVAYDPARWPNYTAVDLEQLLTETPNAESLLVLRGTTRPEPRQWGAWLSTFNNDKPMRWIESFHGPIADRMYDSARYKFLVPAWRRAIARLVGEIDDLEDQVTTILWVLEWISRKVVPIPPALLNRADKLRHSMDCAERLIAGITPFRGFKAEYANCKRNLTIRQRSHRTKKAQLLQWFRDNWGRLLEAAQATGIWFDVGIILGPIMGWIEEGMWGVARKTTDNYLIAVDALAPGYRDSFWTAADELSQAIDNAWEQSWGSIDWDNASIEEAGLLN